MTRFLEFVPEALGRSEPWPTRRVLAGAIFAIGLLASSAAARAQAAYCMTPVGSCPMMMGLPPGSPCRCSAMPMFPGRVVAPGGGFQQNPSYPGGAQQTNDDDDPPPPRHKRQKKVPRYLGWVETSS